MSLKLAEYLGTHFDTVSWPYGLGFSGLTLQRVAEFKGVQVWIHSSGSKCLTYTVWSLLSRSLNHSGTILYRRVIRSKSCTDI